MGSFVDSPSNDENNVNDDAKEDQDEFDVVLSDDDEIEVSKEVSNLNDI